MVKSKLNFFDVSDALLYLCLTTGARVIAFLSFSYFQNKLRWKSSNGRSLKKHTPS